MGAAVVVSVVIAGVVGVVVAGVVGVVVAGVVGAGHLTVTSTTSLYSYTIIS